MSLLHPPEPPSEAQRESSAAALMQLLDLLPETPPPGLLMSMAMRADHGLGMPGFYDEPFLGGSPGAHARRLEVALADARRAYEEMTGRGFWRPDRAAWYVGLEGKAAAASTGSASDFYRASAERLHHLSAGAILRRADGAYLLHRKPNGHHAFATGTVEGGEGLEACLARELLEEMGVVASVDRYAGSSQAQVTDHRGTWTKTTVWFECTVVAEGLPRIDELDAEVVALRSLDGLAWDELMTAVHPWDGVPHDDTRWPPASILAASGGRVASLYYLQDTRGTGAVGNDMLWWRRGGRGYTTDLREAETFTASAAARMEAARGTDRAWPKAYVDSLARPAVDFQVMDKAYAGVREEKAA